MLIEKKNRKKRLKNKENKNFSGKNQWLFQIITDMWSKFSCVLRRKRKNRVLRLVETNLKVFSHVKKQKA